MIIFKWIFKLKFVNSGHNEDTDLLATGQLMEASGKYIISFYLNL
jgi:hypothetical protein